MKEFHDKMVKMGFSRVLELLEQHFAANCEIVLHDLTDGYESTIVDIRHGHITGRKIGDCGSNLGLEVLRGTDVEGDRYNYITHTKDGKILRSSSTYFRDGDKVIGALCINTDITDSVRYESYLHAMNNYSLEIETGENKENKEFFVNDVTQLLDHLMLEGQRLVGKPAVLMSKEERLTFLKYLDDSGAFLISKSSERIGEFLGISKGTLYVYLETLRNAKEEDEK